MAAKCVFNFRSMGPFPRHVEDLKIKDWVMLTIDDKQSVTYLPELVVKNGDAEILEFMLEKNPDLLRWHLGDAQIEAKKYKGKKK